MTVAFLRDTEHATDLWVAPAGGAPRLVRQGVLPSCFPRWSPDAAWIAVAEQRPGGVTVLAVRSDGSGSRVLASLVGSDRQHDALDALGMAWLGGDLVLSDRDGPGGPLRLYRVPANGRPVALTSPPSGSAGDVQPVPSADGSQLAFVRYTSFSEADLYVLTLRTNTVRRVTFDQRAIRGIAWHGGVLVFGSDRDGRVTSLWGIQSSGGSPFLLRGPEGIVKCPSIVNGTIVYQYGVRDANIWSLRQGVATPVTTSSAPDQSPALAPGGRMVAFVSRRSGTPQVWTADLDGSNPVLRTNLPGGYTDSLRWSPDGEHLAFTTLVDRQRDVMLLRLRDGRLRSFSDHPAQDGRPNWSSDGRTLYFRSDRSGSDQLWAQSLDGGVARMVTTTGAYEGMPHGPYLYFVRSRDEQGIWRLHRDGGTPEVFLPAGREGRWTITGGTIATLEDRTITAWSITDKKKLRTIALPTVKPLVVGMSMQHDTILWTQVDTDTNDLYMATIH